MDDSSNVYITGTFEKTVDFDPSLDTFNIIINGTVNYADIFILKLDVNGNFIWVKPIFGSYYIGGHSLAIDDSGSLYLAGFFYDYADFDPSDSVYAVRSGHNSHVGFILKLNSLGDFIWVKTISNESTSSGIMTSCYSISLDDHDNLYVTGIFKGSVDFNPNEGVYNLYSRDYWDVFVLRMRTDGEFLWARNVVSGEGKKWVTSLGLDKFGNIYTSGDFTLTADFNPEDDILNISNNPGFGYFISKLDSLGNFKWAKVIRGGFQEVSSKMAVDIFGNIHGLGTFYITADFDPGKDEYNLSPEGGSDIAIFKWRRDSCADLTLVVDSVSDINDDNIGYSSAYALSGVKPYSYSWNTSPVINDSVAYFDTTGTFEITVTDSISCFRSASVTINDLSTPIDTSVTDTTNNDTINNTLVNSLTSNISLYPNPTTGNITIELGNTHNYVVIELYNITGQLLQEKTFGKANTINMDINVPQGMYFLNVISDNKEKATFKVVRE